MDRGRGGSDERGPRGAAAEDIAAAYLKLRGCDIVDRNVRIAGGEIDIVARRAEWALLVEVRYREGDDHGSPIETIRGRKARAMVRAARAWLCRSRDDATCWRVDAVTVTLDSDGEVRVRHFPGAVSLESDH